MKSLFKRLDTSSHFPDFKHTAKGQRDNKKIRSRKERRMLKEQKAQRDNEASVEMAEYCERYEQTYNNPEDGSMCLK